MKKFGLLIFLIALVGSMALVACVGGGESYFGGVSGSGSMKTEKRDVAPFKAVKAGGAAEVEIAVGGAQSVEIETDDNVLPSVKTIVSGDTLRIEREGNFRNASTLKIKITVPELNGLDISGASRANATNVKADKLTLEASGASRITISGEAREVQAEASGASTLAADNLKAASVRVEASGASSAAVFVVDVLDADASGASRIVYGGNPKEVKKSDSGASSVSAK